MKTNIPITTCQTWLLRQEGRLGRLAKPGFTLLELLVVLGIIGLLAALAMPTLKNVGQSNTMSSANRQLLDDISLARQLAISTRSSVYLVFVPTNHYQHRANLVTTNELKLWTNLMTGRLTAYALLCMRTIGDQPGNEHPRYLTEWRHLPEGTYIRPDKFALAAPDRFQLLGSISNVVVRSFKRHLFPYPTANSPYYMLPYVGFTPDGRLMGDLSGAVYDEVIPLARGSIFTIKDSAGQYTPDLPDVQENPPGNSTNNYNLILVNSMTARARILKPEFP